MVELNDALTQIMGNLEDMLKEGGFEPVYPDGKKTPELPIKHLENGHSRLTYEGKKGSMRLDYFGNKLTLLFSTEKGDDAQGSFEEKSASLLETETFDQRDAKYIAGEISESMAAVFGTAETKGKVKAPKTVSKSAAKSGSVYYDSNTLASRLTSGVFTELRRCYTDNIEQYGDFLADDFFDKYGTPAVLQVIKENNPQKMKKMFGIFNDIYPDATNETQSLITVTILGALDNDQELLARCVDYMSDDLTVPVINVNKYLATSAGKKAKNKLKNPPPYKPKKEKKKGVMSSLLGM